MFVVINPGHVYFSEGDKRNTPGKRSPDSSIIEALWNYEVAELLFSKLKLTGINCVIAKATEESNSLTLPVSICNDYCKKLGTNNVLFVSIHVNAAGNGDWKSARGWSIWTTRGVTKSDKLATLIYNRAKKTFTNVRQDYTDGDPDYESDFYVLRKTMCPAVLVENFFMDNKEDVEFLKTKECKDKCAQVILEGIQDYIKNV